MPPDGPNSTDPVGISPYTSEVTQPNGTGPETTVPAGRVEATAPSQVIPATVSYDPTAGVCEMPTDSYTDNLERPSAPAPVRGQATTIWSPAAQFPVADGYSEGYFSTTQAEIFSHYDLDHERIAERVTALGIDGVTAESLRESFPTMRALVAAEDPALVEQMVRSGLDVGNNQYSQRTIDRIATELVVLRLESERGTCFNVETVLRFEFNQALENMSTPGVAPLIPGLWADWNTDRLNHDALARGLRESGIEGVTAEELRTRFPSFRDLAEGLDRDAVSETLLRVRGGQGVITDAMQSHAIAELLVMNLERNGTLESVARDAVVTRVQHQLARVNLETFKVDIRYRYPVLGNTQYRSHVDMIASRAYERWTAAGHPVIAEGESFSGLPPERFVTEAVESLLQERRLNEGFAREFSRVQSRERMNERKRAHLAEAFRRAAEMGRRR